MTKVIGIGNTLMGDDGIGVLVVKKIQRQLINEGFDVIIGGVNPYIAYELDKEEELIVIDSIKSGLDAGEITVLPLRLFRDLYTEVRGNHDISLIDMLMLTSNSLKGILIGIEIKDIKLNEGLSKEMKESFNTICEKVFQLCLCLKN